MASSYLVKSNTSIISYVYAMAKIQCKNEFFFSAHICYCEHPNERGPMNGIMCGDLMTNKFKRTHYCKANQRCTGTGDPDKGIESGDLMQLCEEGRSLHS